MRDHGFDIGGRKIGGDAPPFIIAELSANHNGSLDKALNIIDAVADAGVDAVKLQTYTADTITLDSAKDDFLLSDGPWAGKTLHNLYQWAHTPWDWHEALFMRARKNGLLAFSSPFDFTAVDFLEKFDPPAYKVASFELVDIPLIEYVASRGRPMIMSTGMASEVDVMEALVAARRAGCDQICLLHCTSGYPTPPKEADLRTITSLAARYNVVPGLSDHTLSTAVPVAAVALGARVIEKHVTLRREDGGADADFSLEPAEVRQLVNDTRTAWEALGDVRSAPRSSEASQSPLRRSLYIAEGMKKGGVFSPENLRSVRPGYGLAPRYYYQLLGRRITRDADKGEPLSWALVDDSEMPVRCGSKD